MPKKIKHNILCQECDSPATVNIQCWWHEYSIDENGDYTEVNDWDGDDSTNYCDKHNPNK